MLANAKYSKTTLSNSCKAEQEIEKYNVKFFREHKRESTVL